MELLGRYHTLAIRRLVPAGALLANGDELLLPARELPAGAKPGDVVEVFVHLDSDDRPIATTRKPKLALGEIAFLTVTSVTDIGAFVDWGLGKELLVPFAEQSRELFAGEEQPFGLYLDKSGRLAATMYVTDLVQPPRRVALDEWIDGVAWRNDPDIGLFAILERRFVGLVPASEPHGLRRGQPAKFRVAHILPDRKIVLSLRKHAHEELAGDAETILSVLAARPVDVGDRSDPELVRELFNLSKKAFKRAVGTLLKSGKVTIDRDGFVRPVQ